MANEVRLIDANALLEAAQHIEQVIDNHPYGTRTIYETVVTADDIENAPTVDAVEVVRCRDCKRYESENGYCRYYRMTKFEGGFCDRGERKDNA